ncbi:MAG: hypothetical protein LBM70_08425 [Victivallales bacterium]|nr:hypothetical protein [Victivallales bacterium]
MENKITQEAKAADDFFSKQLGSDKKRLQKQLVRLPKLSRDNVAKVEAMFKHDQKYSRSSDPNAGPADKPKYSGSVAYWMKELTDALKSNKSEVEIHKAIEEAVVSVDRDNSTHLDADKTSEYNGGRKELTERIFNVKEHLRYYLEKPVESDFELIKIISEKTSAPDPKRSRENLSFASKFCHYACFYMFEGEPEQDNYSILDSVVIKVLPDYIEYFGVKKSDFTSSSSNFKGKKYEYYKIYQKTIDEIIEKSGGEISRNGFDHLLWYYFKDPLHVPDYLELL